MLRIALCLLFALMSSTALAREVKLSSPNGGGCPDGDTSHEPERASSAGRAGAAGADAKLKPSVHSDVPARSQSARWHSYLPGMFR